MDVGPKLTFFYSADLCLTCDRMVFLRGVEAFDFKQVLEGKCLSSNDRHRKTDGFASFGPCCPAAPRCDLFGQFRVFRQKRLVPVAICGYGPWGTSKQKNYVHVHANPLN